MPRTSSVSRIDATRQASDPGDAVTVSVGEARQPQPQPAAEHTTTFHDILSALNPLQYLPVIGTLYRAVTGDQIPELVRRAGSLVVSTLLGGPVGAITSIATTIIEKVTGIDLDKTVQTALSGHGSDAAPPAVPRAAPAITDTTTALLQVTPTAPADTASKGWSPAQLAAHGVSTAKDGTLSMGGTSGADVLNSLELQRLHDANAAYARQHNSTQPAKGGVVL